MVKFLEGVTEDMLRGYCTIGIRKPSLTSTRTGDRIKFYYVKTSVVEEAQVSGGGTTGGGDDDDFIDPGT